jgi:hypothetical protein
MSNIENILVKEKFVTKLSNLINGECCDNDDLRFVMALIE